MRSLRFLVSLVPFRHCIVRGESMLPQYVPGTHLIVFGRLLVRTFSLGDVVILCRPEKETLSLVKRITGLPGDTVLVRGALYRLGEDEYFVEGDFKGKSQDSRAWGPLPKSSIIGKVVYAG